MVQQGEVKSVHTILLDTAPILLNQPSISTLTATCTTLVTTPAVIAEIRGEEARSRFETLYAPFVEVRTPKTESVEFAREFARKTGDLAVLSGTDVEILALAYELECERNGGDWRLRNAPGQKRVNGAPPKKEEHAVEALKAEAIESISPDEAQTAVGSSEEIQRVKENLRDAALESSYLVPENQSEDQPSGNSEILTASAEADEPEPVPELEGDESADSDEGWITPSNIKRKQANDDGAVGTNSAQKTLQVATMTGDFAMQNVLLQINLNLLSTKTCKRISNIKQTIFRCHACFQTTKDMTKQFCPRCGKPTLNRVTCTTNDKGEVKLHLKSNYQWNNRGNVFSVPKPSAGTANQKWKGPQSGGGQSGWGNNLILAEDQKEYQRAVQGQKRTKQKDLMDQDSLPSILTGERGGGSRIQIGVGRNVNSRKR